MGITIRACTPADLERLIPLLDEEFVFGKGRTLSLRQRFPTVFGRDNLPHILLCADADEILSALAMRRFDWVADGEIFKGAMIGAVYTQPARRGAGHASRLLAAAATQLRTEGTDFGVLWTGQPAFYTRLGWQAADCSVLGEIVPDLAQTPHDVTTQPAATATSSLEELRRRWLKAMTVRRPEDYRHVPLPAARVDLLWREDQGQAAYALLGSSGATGFLYELAGHPDGYAALWRTVCHERSRIYVNDRTDSPSCRWLSEHTGISWQNKSLAMWLPLSERVTMPLLGQWQIPYFDRI